MAHPCPHEFLVEGRFSSLRGRDFREERCEGFDQVQKAYYISLDDQSQSSTLRKDCFAVRFHTLTAAHVWTVAATRT